MSDMPITQTVDSVKALLTFMHRPSEPLPEFVDLQDRIRLTLSKDKQAYYLTTRNSCSCPANFYHPEKPCKHMRAFQIDAERREDNIVMSLMAENPRQPKSI